MKAPALPPSTPAPSTSEQQQSQQPHALHLLPLPVLAALPPGPSASPSTAAPVPGLVAGDVPLESLRRALRCAPAGTFAVTFVSPSVTPLSCTHRHAHHTPAHSHEEDAVYRVHCIGDARVPFVCEVRRVPSSSSSSSSTEAWAIGTSTAVHYPSAAAALAELARAGIAHTPLPTPRDGAAHADPATPLEAAAAAVQAGTVPVATALCDAAHSTPAADPHVGTFVVAAGCALAQTLAQGG